MAHPHRVTALSTALLAAIFWLFFGASKHVPALSGVNPFADDPYDAVGSFAVQLAGLTAALSLVRAFRPYQPGPASPPQEVLLWRTEATAVLSVAIALIADAIAMARFPALWLGHPAGLALGALLVAGAALTMLTGWLVVSTRRFALFAPARWQWARAGSISLAALAVLVLYPPGPRESISGAIFTALAGISIFFASVWALGVSLWLPLDTGADDILDDLGAIDFWIRGRWSVFDALHGLLAAALQWPWLGAVVDWLNPRKHFWHAPILAGVLAGLLLALLEAVGEGVAPELGRLFLVASVFVGLESAGLLLGYALLVRPLGIFRREPHHRPDGA